VHFAITDLERLAIELELLAVIAAEGERMRCHGLIGPANSSGERRNEGDKRRNDQKLHALVRPLFNAMPIVAQMPINTSFWSMTCKAARNSA
jgi:hypothetical protein